MRESISKVESFQWSIAGVVMLVSSDLACCAQATISYVAVTWNTIVLNHDYSIPLGT